MKTIFSLDWLTVTLHDYTPMQLEMFLQMLGLDGFKSIGHGGRGFKDILENPQGAKLYARPAQSGSYASLDLSGKVVNHVGFKRITSALMRVECRYSVTRLDFALDTQAFTVDDVWQVVSDPEGAFVTRCQRKYIERYKNLTGESDTVYMGHTSSSARLRVYRKVLSESEFGDEAFTRTELQMRKQRAHDCMQALLEYSGQEEVVTAFAVGFLRGFVDIQHPFWFSWIDTQPVRIAVPRPISTLESIAGWFQAQVAPSLATYMKALAKYDMDNTELERLLKLGREKMKPRHHAMVEGFVPQGLMVNVG